MRHFAPPIEPAVTPTLECLKASEALFEAARIGMWFVDVEAGTLWWSRTTRRIHEVPRDYSPTLAQAIEFYAPAARADVMEVIEKARTEGARWDATYPAITFRGRRILLHSCGFTVAEKGHTRFILGTCEDVTEATERAREHERLALVVRQMTNAAVITDRAGDTLWANQAFERLTGRPLTEFLGRKPGHVLQGPGTDPATARAIGEAIRGGQLFQGEILNYNADGRPYWIELSISPIRDEAGAVTGFVGIESDATPRREAEEAAWRELEARRAAETLLRDILEAVPVVLSAYDRENRLVLVNQQLLETFPTLTDVLMPGCPLETAIRAWYARESGEKFADDAALDSAVEKAVATVSAGINALETRLPDGRWLLSSVRRSPSGNLIWVRTDITAQKRSELEARERASRDALTGLLNRAGFLDLLKRMKARADAAKLPVAPKGCLVVFDVDHFKAVNDVYGHEAGDKLLKGVAQRAARGIRKCDLAARLGGDEFALYLPEVSREEAPARVEQIVAQVGRAIEVGSVRLLPSISAGAALAGIDGTDCEELLRNADRALYEAKRGGRGRIVFYAERLAMELADRHRMAERLRRALGAGRVTVALQPQMRLADGHITGFEALARWHDGERQVPPPEFVAAAEEHGLAERLGRAVMEQALAACARLRAASGQPVQVGVNVTTAQLLAEDFADQVLDRVTRHGLPPEALELEITETVLLDRSFGRIVEQLSGLRNAGVRIALDDFGTGHASLNHVSDLPADALKIDRSFVAAIGRDRRRQLIATTIIGLSRGLQLDCVAEGVETEAQLRFLEGHGCSHVQGFIVGKPMPENEAQRFLHAISRDDPVAGGRPSRMRQYLYGPRCG